MMLLVIRRKYSNFSILVHVKQNHFVSEKIKSTDNMQWHIIHILIFKVLSNTQSTDATGITVLLVMPISLKNLK